MGPLEDAEQEIDRRSEVMAMSMHPFTRAGTAPEEDDAGPGPDDGGDEEDLPPAS